MSLERNFIVLDEANGWHGTKSHTGLSAWDFQSLLNTMLYISPKVFVTFPIRTVSYTRVWTVFTLAVMFKGMIFINP